jgi:NADPH:quinone reductase-like Zn-dependent oxidoreductase
MSSETTMRAIRQESLGGPDVLELVEVPRPTAIPTEVLVRTLAAGVNPVDWKSRARGGFLGEPPFTVGWDVAGVVEEVGFGVTRFAVGDRVFGMPRFPREAAAYAEYVTSPSRQLARIPDGLSDVEAGALPLAGLTAWQALVETADVRPGQRVLVLAAAGGVGPLAVQIA